MNCRRFIDSSALSYTTSALTSHEKEIRQVAYQILSRFQHHLSTARFREKQQVRWIKLNYIGSENLRRLEGVSRAV